MMNISQAAFDLIVNEETGGQAYYNRTEIHPDWPGGASGVTIGIGYDCGYSDPSTIRADWGPLLPAAIVAPRSETRETVTRRCATSGLIWPLASLRKYRQSFGR